MNRSRRRLALGLASLIALPAQAAPFVRAGAVTAADVDEISGLAASRRTAGLFWALNDSGNAPVLYALDHRGTVRQRVTVEGAPNVDWEDLAWLEIDGAPWLAIADTGDNLAWRTEVAIYLVPEPAAEATQVPVGAVIRLRYADGPRDVEAVAFDAQARRLLLLEKGAADAGLYAVPLAPQAELQVATRVAALGPLWPPAPGAAIAPISARRFRGAATALDISADGRRMLALTYRHLLVWQRQDGEDWVAALARAPAVHALPATSSGYEAACFDADDRSIWVTHETLPAQLYWLRAP